MINILFLIAAELSSSIDIISSPAAEALGRTAFTNCSNIEVTPVSSFYRTKKIKLIYSKNFFDANLTSVLFEIPYRKNNFSTLLKFYDAGKMEVEFSNGVKKEVDVMRDFLCIFNYSREFKKFHFGLSYRYFSSKLAEYTSATSLYDFGIGYKSKYFSIITAFRNYGGKLRYIKVEDEITTTYLINILFEINLFNKVFGFITGIEKSSNIDYYPIAIYIHNNMGNFLRLSYRFNDFLTPFSIGTKIEVGSGYIEYSYTFSRFVNSTHRFAIGIPIIKGAR
ncbi:MAG: hypothetical protein NZ870_04100 [bacterium]|nr:hypothetical protein [bacterium]